MMMIIIIIIDEMCDAMCRLPGGVDF